MKSKYLKPALTPMALATSNLVAASLAVSNEEVTNVEGDVKQAGDWDDIWE